jgi:lysophospholipase L1-like esterase
MNLFIFGDSIVHGYWDSDGGWADKVKAYALDEDIKENFKYYHGVYNLGIDGNTAQQIIDRFDNEAKARFWPDTEYGFIFAVGVNDTVHRNNIGYVSTPKLYGERIQKLHKLASEYSSNITFVNLLPVNEELTNPVPFSSTGKCYTNQRIEVFNNKLKEVCGHNNASLIDVHSSFMSRDYKKLLADGLHPNSDGHKLIYDAVLPTINSWLF